MLLVQAMALPALWSEGNRLNRVNSANAVPPSRHGPQPVFPPMAEEPVYPPSALPTSLLSMDEAAGQIPTFDPMIPGYIPTSTPFDNPSTLSTPIDPLPSTPDCSVRPPTVVEIQRMRESASKIAVMMQQETLIMDKRKTYVEQMTVYINDRIHELNKVKRELGQETRWLGLSSARITELEEKEKLIKLQDIQTCLNERTSASNAEGANVGRTLADITAQATAVQAQITQIQARMDALNAPPSSTAGFL